MTQASASSSSSSSFEYIFAFGSIINTDTHAQWLGDNEPAVAGQRAILQASFGYRRGWTFRSKTGFTALGLYRYEDNGSSLDTGVNGVVFRVPCRLVAQFDVREQGYDRVAVPYDNLRFQTPVCYHEQEMDLKVAPTDRIWIYIPQQPHVADEEHPVLQSYVDTVLQGCLRWGGEDMAREFIVTTHEWSPFFLNDTPSSRRPWLFRKDYDKIDHLLSINHTHTHFAERKHPEEFAGVFHKRLRGTWSLPKRNVNFVGRDHELRTIHSTLVSDRQNRVAKMEVIGMGGVGKSQLAIEYCYRYYPSYYGLVIWLRAHSTETLAQGYRQLVADTTGTDVKDKEMDEIILEVKARLFRSKVPWLLVLDNLDDHSLLDKFLPNGGLGHVLVTTRLVDENISSFGDQSLFLSCFEPDDSVELLCRTIKVTKDPAHLDAAYRLSNMLGQLPLALNMAAVYMKRCDVDIVEYLERYSHAEARGLMFHGHQILSSSLFLSMEAIRSESSITWETLRLLCWIGPEQISKKLVRALLMAKHDTASDDNNFSTPMITQHPVAPKMMGILVVVSVTAMLGNRARKITAPAVACVGAILLWHYHSTHGTDNLQKKQPVYETVKLVGNVSVFEQTDEIWRILKSFSLLSVKDGKGSMHRMLGHCLRMDQNEDERRQNLLTCLRAFQREWVFKPEQVSTWDESTLVLEHLKAYVSHCLEHGISHPNIANLSSEAGIFAAMSLNHFEDAQTCLEQALQILDLCCNSRNKTMLPQRATILHELGRVFRYQGRYQEAENCLLQSLGIRQKLKLVEFSATLHELGILESKKHNLDLATDFLKRALEIRQALLKDKAPRRFESECAATLHQLAAVLVARRPPEIFQAEQLLKEALALDMQIGQRAATLKQLARVFIRRGDLLEAGRCLDQALELYVEMYGEGKVHINVAAVKFQKGALCFQRERFDEAEQHLTECLRIRRAVYQYSEGMHLEVASVMHELGCVAFAQKRFSKAAEMFLGEGDILEHWTDVTSQHQRIHQARLTNLTWLYKCAKEQGDEESTKSCLENRNRLKRQEKERQSGNHQPTETREDSTIQQKLLRARLLARGLALSANDDRETVMSSLQESLDDLHEMACHGQHMWLTQAALNFRVCVLQAIQEEDQCCILQACDDLRDILRNHGITVNDSTQATSKSCSLFEPAE